MEKLIERVRKSALMEREQAIEMYEETERLSELMKQLMEMRREVMILARQRDIEYIDKFDNVIKIILETLVESKESLAGSIRQIIESGNAKALKELMIALGITLDKREMLLGFDETRGRREDKKKLKLRVLFSGPDGTRAGVSYEEESS